MNGQILDYSVPDNKGTISGQDGNRYYFAGAEWKGSGVPARGMSVDFEADGQDARSVYIALGSAASAGSKDKIAAGLLAVFLGWLGIHKFYLGFTGPGLVFLLINTIGLAVTWLLLFLPNIVVCLIAIIEGIIYLTKSDEEFHQVYVVEKKQWF
jgi:TM2 domain-containing membrane protein YozV